MHLNRWYYPFWRCWVGCRMNLRDLCRFDFRLFICHWKLLASTYRPCPVLSYAGFHSKTLRYYHAKLLDFFIFADAKTQCFCCLSSSARSSSTEVFVCSYYWAGRWALELGLRGSFFADGPFERARPQSLSTAASLDFRLCWRMI